MSRTLLVIVALVVGAVLAVGGSFATTQLVGNSTPSNQAPYNYGG